MVGPEGEIIGQRSRSLGKKLMFYVLQDIQYQDEVKGQYHILVIIANYQLIFDSKDNLIQVAFPDFFVKIKRLTSN